MADIFVRSLRTPYTKEISAGEFFEHRVISDEPDSLGGANRGATPYDLLLAALGSCTAITIEMYAKRKKWPLESVSVSLTYDRVHAKDCEECEADESYIHQIDRKIRLLGALSEEQRKRLMEIASHCPVHKTLTGKILISDTETAV